MFLKKFHVEESRPPLALAVLTLPAVFFLTHIVLKKRHFTRILSVRSYATFYVKQRKYYLQSTSREAASQGDCPVQTRELKEKRSNGKINNDRETKGFVDHRWNQLQHGYS
jgi:hypothetical protein